MDFLTKLYSNENFGIILFASISILVLIFLIILFFGKKDQSERKAKLEKENENNENNNINSEVAFQDIEPATSLESPIIEQPILNNTIETPENPLFMNMESPITESQDFSNEPTSPSITEISEPEYTVPEPPKTDFDFDALAASISKELESIGISNVETEEKEAPTSVMERPIIEEVKEPQINTIEEIRDIPEINPNPVVFETPKQPEPTIELQFEKEQKESTPEKITMPSKTQFSSVFVNRKNEEPIVENKEETKTNTPIPEPIPVKPSFELPKTIDLPKLQKDPEPKVEPVIEENVSNIIFPSLENDIPAYPKNDENRM